MRPQLAAAIMLFFVSGFAQIRAEIIPDGIMPKRQAAGTGVSTTTTDPTVTTDTPTVTSETTTDPGTTQDPVTSDTTTQDPGTTDAGTTTELSTADPTTTEPSPASSPADPSTSIPTTIAVTTTNGDGSTVTSQIATDTLAPASSTGVSAPISTDSSDSDIVRIGSSTINRSTLSSRTVVSSALIGESTSREVLTRVWTSDGQVFSSVVTENRIFSSTTGYATATISPSLASGGGDGSNLSDNAKRVIGGVVGGIGGAILIGGLAFVAWRLWGKRKAAQEEPDEIWGGSRPDSIETAKRSSGMTLANETYSNPGGRINASSNF